jgi:hypothetical protein
LAGPLENSFARQDNGHGFHENYKVQSQRPLSHIITVLNQHFSVAVVAATADLPQTGNPRVDGFALLDPPNVVCGAQVFEILVVERPRADETHFPPQDMNELGKLVQAPPSKELSHASDSRVSRNFEQRPLRFVERRILVAHPFRVHFHGTKLQHVEQTPVLPSPNLAKEGGAGTFNTNDRGDQKEKGGQYHEQQKSEEDIETTFQEVVPSSLLLRNTIRTSSF